MATVNVHAAKANLYKLIEQALAGEDVIIARGSQPLVRLVPMKTKVAKRQPGTLKGKLTLPDSFFEPLPEADLDQWDGA